VPQDLRAETALSRLWDHPRLLPCFVLAGRLDVAETIGTVLEEVVDGPGGMRPAAARADVFHTTARSWLRRFLTGRCASASRFARFASSSWRGDRALRRTGPLRDLSDQSAFAAASALPGWASIGLWRFVSSVSGGRLIATNTDSPYLVVGKRRFMPPVPSL